MVDLFTCSHSQLKTLDVTISAYEWWMKRPRVWLWLGKNHSIKVLQMLEDVLELTEAYLIKKILDITMC